MKRILLSAVASLAILAGAATPAAAAEPQCVELLGWSSCTPQP